MPKVLERKTLTHFAVTHEDIQRGHSRCLEEAITALRRDFSEAIAERGVNQPKRILRFKLIEEEIA